MGIRKDGMETRDEDYYFTGMATTRRLMVCPTLSSCIIEQIARENTVAEERRKAREERQLARPMAKATAGACSGPGAG